MKMFLCTESKEIDEIFEKATDKQVFFRDLGIFATYDFGASASMLMDYQQTAMQWIKDYLEKKASK